MADPSVPEIHHPRRILVTGGAGFIGCNLVRHLLTTHGSLRVVVLDALTYAGSVANLDGIDAAHPGRYRFIHGDIRDLPLLCGIFADEAIDTVIHLAAESHVDRSIADPLGFVSSNVLGTATLLHAARLAWRDRDDVRFHHVSTDEVFGSLGPVGCFDETSPYAPSSPYSASKAGSDHLVRAWGRTYGLPVTVSNCSNNYGPYQFPEKLIPLMIANALAGRPLPVYGDGRNVRDWLHVDDHADAIDRVMRCGLTGATYCVGGGAERGNIDIVRGICALLDELRPDPGGPHERLIAYVADRPGHDLRYAIDPSRIGRELGWRPRRSFAAGLRDTVAWYLGHAEWLRRMTAVPAAHGAAQ